MSQSCSLWAGLSFLLLLGCGAASDVEPVGAPPPGAQSLSRDRFAPDETGPWRPPSLSPDLLYPVPDLLAWTKAGDLAVVAGTTGAVKQAVTTLALAGARDVAYDPGTQRAFIAESDDEGELGEIASYPVAAGVLGVRAHEAWLLGEARLQASPLGVLSFEDDSGGRWRLLGGGSPSADVAAPLPMSAWVTTAAGATTVHALAYGPASGELDAVTAPAQPGAIGAAGSEPFGLDAGTLPPCARIVPAPLRGGALMLDVSGSFLSVRSASGTFTGGAALVPLGGAGLRIEDAVSLRGGKLVAVLLSGTTQVLALEINPHLEVASMASVKLPGQPSPSTRLVSHDLAEQGYGRVVAATSAGVFSIQVRKDAIGVHVARAPGFDGSALRGPIAPIWAPN